MTMSVTCKLKYPWILSPFIFTQGCPLSSTVSPPAWNPLPSACGLLTHVSTLAGIIWDSGAASIRDCQVFVEFGITKPNSKNHSKGRTKSWWVGTTKSWWVGTPECLGALHPPPLRVSLFLSQEPQMKPSEISGARGMWKRHDNPSGCPPTTPEAYSLCSRA